MTINDIPKNINSIQVGNFDLDYHGSYNEYYKDIAIDDLILVTDNTDISTTLPTMYKSSNQYVVLNNNNYIFGYKNDLI